MPALLIILVTQAWIYNITEAAKILAIFPSPSFSHQVVFRSLTQELARKGHDVTVLTTDPAFPKGETPRHLTEIDVHDISYKIWTETFMKASKGRKSDIVKQVDIAFYAFAMVFDAQLETDEVQKILTQESNTYDLLILEACVRPTLIFSYVFKAPVIIVSSLGGISWNYKVIGAPEHPIIYPHFLRQRLHNLTTSEKYTEIYNSYLFTKIFENKVSIENELLRRRFGSDIPSVEDLTNNIDMLFLNSNPVFEGIRPVPPSVIYMGGLHQNATKPLPTFINVCAPFNMSALLLILVIHAWFYNSVEAARILAVFPTPSISHQVVFRTLTQELARKGHEVTVLTTDPAFPKGKAPQNLTEIDVHDISYKIWTETFMKASKGSKSDLIKQIELAVDTFPVVFDAQLETHEVQKILAQESNTYDLLLLEACVRSALVISHVFKAPVISVSSFKALSWNYEVVGVPGHLIMYPDVFRQRLYHLTTWEKITEIYNNYLLTKIFENKVSLEDELLRKRFGSDTPSVEDLTNNIDMLFLNSYPVFDGIRPVPQSVIYMGGLHQNPPKALPTDLKEYLDSSKLGVIYVSFGTNVDSTLLHADKVQILVRVFSKLPYKVLFKWDDTNLPGCSENIKISKWLPQSDLLRHPNVKLFITQGGLQSTDEAIRSGVPLIGIPMLADQWYNTEKYVHHRIGLQLDWDTLTEEHLMQAINQVISDESYRRNIVKLHTLMTDQPMTSLERAVWWVEYVIRHRGAKHLRSPAANMSWWNYLELNLVLTVLGALVVISTMFVTCLYMIYRYIKNQKTKIKKL